MLRLLNKLYSTFYILVLKLRFGVESFSIVRSTIFYRSARVRVYDRKQNAIQIDGNGAIRGEIVILGHGGSVKIGNYCFMGEGSKIWSALSIKVGDRVLISHNVNIYDSQTHPISAVERHQEFVAIMTTGFLKKNNLGEREVVIGDDVLISSGSTILRGVRLGEGSIVGAGSVVTQDVPPWHIVAGNPAKIIREIPIEER